MKKVLLLLSLFLSAVISPPATAGLSASDNPSIILVNHRDRGCWSDGWDGHHGHHHEGHHGGHHGHGGHHSGHGHH